MTDTERFIQAEREGKRYCQSYLGMGIAFFLMTAYWVAADHLSGTVDHVVKIIVLVALLLSLGFQIWYYLHRRRQDVTILPALRDDTRTKWTVCLEVLFLGVLLVGTISDFRDWFDTARTSEYLMAIGSAGIGLIFLLESSYIRNQWKKRQDDPELFVE